MASLTSSHLQQAQKYIAAGGAGKNPISLVMELGQLLNISPVFNSYEPPDLSSIHKHVFVCEVRFANLKVKCQGLNKKQVKTDVARKLIERITMEADRETAPVERQTPVRTGAGAQRRGILWEREVNSHPVETSLPETAKPIANWVGRLQEYLVKYERGLPDYKFEESNDKIRNLYSATVKIPGVRGAYQATAYNKADAKQLAAKKMFNAISKSGSEGTQAAQASQDRLSVRTLRSYLKNHTEEKPANADSGQDDSFETFVDAFSKIDFEEGNPEKTIQTSIEVLKRLSTLEKFDIEYHDVPTTRNSYLCLLEAKIGQSLVCHGIGENRPQAMEKAAESMLELVRFFKHFKKER